MLKYFSIIFFSLFSLNVYSNDNLLTIQQQLERLQREVSDLSQTVFSNQNNSKVNSDSDLVNNLSAIDMRIYDLEKDIKNLTGNIEEVFFQLEDLIQKINIFEENISLLEKIIPNISKKISLENLAVGEESKTMYLDQTHGYGPSFITEEENSLTIEVQMMPLQNILKKNNIKYITCLKIDIEGYEDRALLPFLENYVKKCPHPNFAVWMILFGKRIPDTLNN